MRLPHPGWSITTKFVLGLDANRKVPAGLAEEAREHGDVVFVDHVEHSKGLAVKVRHLFKWVHDNCGSYKFVLKTDDDR